MITIVNFFCFGNLVKVPFTRKVVIINVLLEMVITQNRSQWMIGNSVIVATKIMIYNVACQAHPVSKKVRCPYRFISLSVRVNGPCLVAAQRSGGSLETPPPLARDNIIRGKGGSQGRMIEITIS